MSPKAETSQPWASTQSTATRRNLIVAAIGLMAEKGVDGVSLRSINATAGAGNTSAAHYHFGSKLGLVTAMVDAINDEVTSVRGPLIEPLRSRTGSPSATVREIVEAAYLPYMGLMFHSEFGLPALRFLSRMIVDTSPAGRALVNRLTEPLAADVLELLEFALPSIPRNVLQLRILFSLTNLINGMSDVTALETSPFGDVSTPGSLEAAEHFMQYIVAGLSAPPSNLDERFQSIARGVIATYSERESSPSE